MSCPQTLEILSVVFPTRNRPEWLRRIWQSAKDTANTMPEFSVYIDHDDTLSVPVCQELGIKYRQGQKYVYTENYNQALVLATGSVILEVADDFVFRTKDWDLKILAEFDKVPDKLILVHGYDGTEGSENATHFAVHRHWINILGYLFPPYFRWANADVFLTKVAKSIGRQVYIPTMLVEHMHLCQGKATADGTYKEASERISKYAWADIRGYHSLDECKADIEADAEKLRKAIQFYAENHSYDNYKPADRSNETLCIERGLDLSSSRGPENTIGLESSGGRIPKSLRPRFVR